MRKLVFIILFAFISCQQEKPTFTAQQIVNKSIEFSGFDSLHSSEVSFQFRDKFYTAKRNNGTFKLTRTFTKDDKTIKDVLTNTSFQRFVNDSLISLSDKKKNGYSNSVNSVHYFSVLPFGLNDKAVHKKLLPSVKIKGVDYYKIHVTFSEDGGGEDFDDVFLYWFKKDKFQLDYLAYKYHTNGGGVRFRDIKNEQRVNRIRFVNYNNYKPLDKNIDFFTIDKLYENNKSQKISEINLETISVQLF